MRVIIAGSRETSDALAEVAAAMVDAGLALSATEILSGCSGNVDKAGEHWAEQRGVPVTPYQAHWKLHGKAAGPIRNEAMARNADALIAIWDGRSRGTGDMIAQAIRRGLPVWVRMVRA